MRFMTKGQRAMAAAKVLVLSTTEGAKLTGATQAYVSRARQVLDADGTLADAVLAGDIPLNEAYRTITERKRETERLAGDRARLMEEVRREAVGVRWCFVCRKRRRFDFVVKAPTEPSYYGPSPFIVDKKGHVDGAVDPAQGRDQTGRTDDHPLLG